MWARVWVRPWAWVGEHSGGVRDFAARVDEDVASPGVRVREGVGRQGAAEFRDVDLYEENASRVVKGDVELDRHVGVDGQDSAHGRRTGDLPHGWRRC